MVTLSKRIESRGKTEGEMGVLSENMFNDFCKDGSEKEGLFTGLTGGDTVRGTEGARGGKSEDVNRGRLCSTSCTGGKVEGDV